MEDSMFGRLQNALMLKEKLSIIYSAILTADILNHYELSVKKVMSVRCPGVDFSKVSMVGDAIDVIKTKDVSRLADGTAIEPNLDRSNVKDVGPAMKVKAPESRYRDYKKHKFR